MTHPGMSKQRVVFETAVKRQVFKGVRKVRVKIKGIKNTWAEA